MAIIFESFLESARTYSSTNMAKITLSIDKKKINHETWAALTKLDLEDDVMLKVMITPVEEAEKLVAMGSDKPDLDEDGIEQNPYKAFHRSFFLGNGGFHKFLNEKMAGANIQTGEEAKSCIKKYFQVNSITDIPIKRLSNIRDSFVKWRLNNRG